MPIPKRLIFLSLVAGACGADPNSGDTVTTSGGGSSSPTAGGASTDTPTEVSSTASADPCILGSKGCACVDGLCLGDLQCQEGICDVAPTNSTSEDSTGQTTTEPAACGNTVNGNISIINSEEFDKLAGVSSVNGGVTIAANLGAIPQLSCLEVAASMTLSAGNDYSAMQAIRKVDSLTLQSGPNTTWPIFTELTDTSYLALFYVDEVLTMPKLATLSTLTLDSSSAPKLSPSISLIDYLVVTEDQGDYSSIEGLTVNRISVNGYTGTSLPAVTALTNVNITQSPNLSQLSLKFPDIFPAGNPKTMDEESNARLYIDGTALSNLNEISNISTHTARPGIVNNLSLIDISGLAGSTVTLGYVPPPEWTSVAIHNSPLLCRTHAQMVVDSMNLPSPASLFKINDDC